jgi:carbohydrate kinase (thermoresistant glucokinase family)
VVVVMTGPAGSGKTVVGSRVAERLGVPFVDADDLHSEAARAQMGRGIGLTEEQRGPWLARVNAAMRAMATTGGVVACSALTRHARTALVEGVPDVAVVFLDVPEPVLHERLARRSGHYAGPSLLPSQLATLERPDEAFVVDASGGIDETVELALAAITGRE